MKLLSNKILLILSFLSIGSRTGTAINNDSGSNENEGSDCSSSPETGMCKGYFPRWYYDTGAKRCQKFIYGGCGGNGNQYSTEMECIGVCGEVSEDGNGDVVNNE